LCSGFWLTNTWTNISHKRDAGLIVAALAGHPAVEVALGLAFRIRPAIRED
jgi:hypothetical protein